MRRFFFMNKYTEFSVEMKVFENICQIHRIAKKQKGPVGQIVLRALFS